MTRHSHKLRAIDAIVVGIRHRRDNRHAMTKWPRHPNLQARPSLNRGPVQRRALRALQALGEASTSEVARWTHRHPTRRRTRHTRAVLGRIAEIVGRAPTRGRPWLWRLRKEVAEGNGRGSHDLDHHARPARGEVAETSARRHLSRSTNEERQRP
jgi:hypothetical protein